MLMNFSEKINNSKYNMPLKVAWKLGRNGWESKRKSHFYFKTQFWRAHGKTQSQKRGDARCEAGCEMYVK